MSYYPILPPPTFDGNDFATWEDGFTDDECNEIINRTLYDGVSAISSLITKRGRINIDFADVKTIMAFIGKAMFGVGQASGDDRAVIAAKTSISNPMLDGINLRDAKGCLLYTSDAADEEVV